MKSPYQMKTIQIQITNACPNKCSNCTRFCGWHEESFFMDFETFKKAVDSLQGYEGQIGIMGGEPTLHPQFDKFVDYLNSKVEQKKEARPLVIPEIDMSTYRDVNQGDICTSKGLWSSCGNKYYEHFEKIQDTFKYQCLNDHSNSGEHQALLVARKDLGIEDNVFEELRNNCWIQNMWSASITPKGCFFCEVAAALDMLFDGEGGVPIEKGWYLKRPSDFGDQLKWCELCSACLKVPSKKGNEGIDIISPTLYEMLKDKKSYKAINKKYEIFTKENYLKYDGKINVCTVDPYLQVGMDRISLDNNHIKPHKINICNLNGQAVLINKQNNCFELGESITVESLESKQFDDWCLIIRNDCEIDLSIFNRIYNPGVLYINQDYYFVNKRASSLKKYKIDNYLEKRFIENKKCFIGKFHVEEQNIKYSFLMPTYNSSKTIRTAIESILNQDYKNFNVYFCDDCSTDNTIEIIQEYMKKDDRIKYIAKNNQNSSAVFSRNKLIDLADGDYSVWVDSDDEVNTNICSFATWLLNQEKFDIITFPFELVNHSQNHNNYGKLYEYHHKYYGKDCYDFFMFKMKNYYNLWSKVIDTNLLKKSRVQDVSVYLVDDHLFAYPLYYNCQSFLSVNSEKMYIYNFGQGNWGQNKLSLQKYIKNCNSLITAFDLTYDYVLKHSPELKYIKQVFEKSDLSYPSTELAHVQNNQQALAYQYYIKKFSFLKNFLINKMEK